MFYFLRADYELLCLEMKKIEMKIMKKIEMKIREIGKEMGRSCNEDAETFHDNFAHEDGTRQQHMWSTRLRELAHVKNAASIIDAPTTPTEVVGIGRRVVVRDDSTGRDVTYTIGSYMVFGDSEDGERVISYNSPLAQALIGSKVGENVEGKIGGRAYSMEIIRIT